MQIKVIVATRNRPRQAAAVIECARSMSSGLYPVEYVVACDDDDPADTAGFFRDWPGVMVDCRPRPKGVAQVFNRNAMDADLFVALADDGFVSPYWDREAVKFTESVFEGSLPSGVSGYSLAAFSWFDIANPAQATIITAHREWIDLAGFLDERFPFWFADTAVAELWSFVCARPMPMVHTMVYCAKPGVFNPRLRDMDLWWDFYIATRKERLAKAAEIRERLGITFDKVLLDRLVAEWEARDREGREQSLKIAGSIPARDPTMSYLEAKAAAEAYLRLAA